MNRKIIEHVAMGILVVIGILTIFSFVKYHAINLPFGWKANEYGQNIDCGMGGVHGCDKRAEPVWRGFPFLWSKPGDACETKYSFSECNLNSFPKTLTEQNMFAGLLNVIIFFGLIIFAAGFAIYGLVRVVLKIRKKERWHEK